MVADGQRERQRIFHDDRVTADLRLFADATKLVHAGIRADVRAILDYDVTRERGRVCHDDAIADQAIVRNVGLGHDQTIVADPREHSAPGGATMNRDELADVVALANNRLRGLAFVFQILRRETDGDEWKDVRAGID